MRFAVALLIGIACAVPLQAQSASPAFEAASVRPLPSCHGRPIDLRFLPGRFDATTVRLEQLIQQVYAIRPDQLIGGPAWVRGDCFDVTATTDGTVSRDRAMLMLQSLLADRFALHLTRETRSRTAYTLTAPNPHNLRVPAKPDERPLVARLRNDGNGYVSFGYQGRNATMAALADGLAQTLEAPVSDKTGLTGSYDFTINYTYDFVFNGLQPDPNVPTIFTALQNQLGLKLERGTAPVNVFVIQHASKPPEN